MKTILTHILISCYLIFSCATVGFSQVETKLLFQKKEILKIKIEANMKALLKDKGDKPTYHPANLSYLNEFSEPVSLPINIRTRGHFRRSSGSCKFPPVMLNFAKKKVKNTVFDKQNKLKLVTQCQGKDYVFHEYLVYEMYNLITDFSFKARLAEVTYIDSSGKRKPQTHFNFILEDETDVAKRNGAKLFEPKMDANYLLDSFYMATVSLFNYMIGNNDFASINLHNLKLYVLPDKNFIPVSYDLDFAGIVEANYASPPPEMNITSVRIRVYRGLNYTPTIFNAVFEKFNKNKTQIYALYTNNPLLDAGYVKRTIKYLDEFYEQINDPKAIKKYFTAGIYKF